MKHVAMIGVALVLAVGSVWRASVAVAHFQAAQAAANDPSIRELEQVGAFLEGGLALLLLIHAAAAVVLLRRAIEIRWPYAGAVAVATAVILSVTLLGAPVLAIPGVYPLAIVASIFLLPRFLEFGWVSLYGGAAAGCVVAWIIGGPEINAFACLFVVGPCVVLAFIGAGLRRLVSRAVSARA